jgi:hypothetical protein
LHQKSQPHARESSCAAAKHHHRNAFRGALFSRLASLKLVQLRTPTAHLLAWLQLIARSNHFRIHETARK